MKPQCHIDDNAKILVSLKTLLNHKSVSFDLYEWREVLFPQTELQEHFGYEAHKVLNKLLELDVIVPHTVDLQDHAYSEIMTPRPNQRKRALNKMLTDLERQSELIKKWDIRPTTTIFMIDKERVAKALRSIERSYFFTADFNGIIENELMLEDLSQELALA